jgi:tRNA pseudouridine38-40 synthase
MNLGAEYLLQQKDFSSFAKSGTNVSNFLCDIRSARWTEQRHSLTFEIRANRFLRNMVRSIVGTLVEIGLGKLKVEDLEGIFAAKKRSKAGRSMPADGLYLMEVKYPEGYFTKR